MRWKIVRRENLDVTDSVLLDERGDNALNASALLLLLLLVILLRWSQQLRSLLGNA